MNVETIRKTLKLDIGRGVFEGITQSAVQTLALVILIKVYLQPAGLKGENLQALIFGSTFAGMIGSLFYESMASRWGFNKSTLMALPTFISAAFIGLSFLSPSPHIFTACICIAFFCLPLKLPFQTSIYEQNFPKEKRGTFHARALILMQLTTVGFTYFAGLSLDDDLSSAPYILALVALCTFVAGLLMRKMPSDIPEVKESRNPFRALRWAKKDPLFGYVLFIWFLFGFANLWMFPMRITYLAQELNFKPGLVTLLAGVIPEAARLLFLPLWARLFDRMNFIALRMAMNFFLALGIFFFFTFETSWLIGLGAFFYGVGFSGGRLAWQLWVTKMAPPERTSEYMAVHVSLTGLRGSIGPFIGYAILALFVSGNGYQIMGWISTGLMVLSILLLAPLISHGKRFR